VLRRFRRLPRLTVDPGVLNWIIIILSVLLCAMLSLGQLPGTEIAGVGVNWLLIWVVSWSIRRSPLQGAIAGVILGLIQDALTAPHPSHVLGLVIAGSLTALLQKQRYIQEDFISAALIVFAMAILTETILALQLTFMAQSSGLADGIGGPGDFSLADSLLEAETNGLNRSSAVQQTGYQPPEIWSRHQRVALSSAIVSSLWAPLIAYPLNRWWEGRERSQELGR
jgi:rod shape-determining protein MreD